MIKLITNSSQDLSIVFLNESTRQKIDNSLRKVLRIGAKNYVMIIKILIVK
ncbi:hypothetical protein BCL90_3822 [Pedobacter alluvionis]|uniref:Uncharacterized protein n=1 Tax=Pedobacter alluvionis TaxID=475253 RepID=A0A497Y0T1_9SPHI|nr:hypothetical protein BCL90_3822 [Pedobacter alluvionis]